MKSSLLNSLMLFLTPVLAQELLTVTIDDSVVAVGKANLSAAASFDGIEASDATANLFPSESVQLTDAVIANLSNLSLSHLDLFSFESSSEAVTRRKSAITSKLKCKTYPGDALWPTTALWNLFDILLGGALIKTIPYAAPCYNDFGVFDKAKCDDLSTNWVFGSALHAEDPTSINGVLFQGLTCMPPMLNPTGKNCSVGGYPDYAVSVKNVAQIQLAVNLARNLNIRLVIKNTGHDFNAKSTGKGSLSIWTHNLKDIQFMKSYKEAGYSGPAFKVGSGVQAFEIYEAANANNVKVVGGEGRTVGVMGGYILGGGHSPLSSIYGMAADQVLSMEVVTAAGRFVTASTTKNSDLFWALCGGGGSTFGVVTSVVSKAYPKIKVTTMTYELKTSSGISAQQFWAALLIFFNDFIKYTDAGNYE